MEAREPEVWKPIPGYEGIYEVSSWGNVKSLEREIYHKKNKCLRTISEKLLAIHIRGTYQFVNLYKNNIRDSQNVNILVAMAFLDNFSKDKIVNHLDKNKLNNYYKNLEMISYRENTSYSNDKTKTSSKLVGVCVTNSKNKNGKRYKQIRSEISIKGKKILLGSFKTEEDAHQAYLKALKEYGLENKYATES